MQKGITPICIPIWVVFNEAKCSPALLETVVFHVFLFCVLHKCLYAMYRIISCTVFF